MHDHMKEEYWSRFPDTYDEKMKYVVGEELIEAIVLELNNLPELGELVEFGCGTGIYTEKIVAKTTQMYATDLSDSLLKVAGTRLGNHPKITLQKENCMATSFSSDAFDSVFMANLIHVVDRPDALLQECRRILRKDGTLVIATFTNHEMKLWEKIKMGVRFVKSWGKPPPHTHSFTPETLASIITNQGFVIKKSMVVGNKTKALFIIAQ